MAKESLYITTSGRIQKRSTYPEVYSVSSPIRLKRGDSTTLKIAFLTETSAIEVTNGPGESAEEAAATMVMVGLKEVGKYDEENFVAEANVTGIDGDGFYLVDLDLNTAALNTLLGALDADTDNDINEVTLMFEITWSVSGGGDSATDWSSTKFVNCVVENDVIRNNEAEATAASRNMTLISAIPVDTNDDKLLLTNLPLGQTVMVTDEGRRVEQYLGSNAGILTAIRIAHPVGLSVGGTAMNANYTYSQQSAGKGLFESGNLSHTISWDGSTEWSIIVDSVVCYTSTDDVATPDLVTTWTPVSTAAIALDPLTSAMVTQAPEGTESNWRDVVSGFDLIILQTTGSNKTVNGVVCPTATFTRVGWVGEGTAIPISASLVPTATEIAVTVINEDGTVEEIFITDADVANAMIPEGNDGKSLHIGSMPGKTRSAIYST